MGRAEETGTEGEAAMMNRSGKGHRRLWGRKKGWNDGEPRGRESDEHDADTHRSKYPSQFELGRFGGVTVNVIHIRPSSRAMPYSQSFVAIANPLWRHQYHGRRRRTTTHSQCFDPTVCIPLINTVLPLSCCTQS